MILYTEIVLFSPYHPLGFRIAFFGFADFGLIGYSPNIFKNEFYTSLGIGVRLRNERLVFNTIQIRLGIAFGKPGLVESEYFRLSNATRLEPWRSRPTRPGIVAFENPGTIRRRPADVRRPATDSRHPPFGSRRRLSGVL